MSIGEILGMYDEGDLIINPDFQRLFRWSAGQKSKLIESILLGIPIPSIFVFERDDGTWELIDGLQRVSTLLEFTGALLSPDGGVSPPSILEATKYLPSLHNVVWDISDQIENVPTAQQNPLDKPQQLAIRRARLSVEILKRPSENHTKFELFQRLNAGGTQANAQELRNCIMIMVNPHYYQTVKQSAERDKFKEVIGVSEDQVEKQRHLEFATRFLVHSMIPYDGALDVEEYIDEGIQQLCHLGDTAHAASLLDRTFDILFNVAQGGALRRYHGGRHSGRIGLVALEGIAVGVAKNIDAIQALPDPQEFVRDRMQNFWQQPEIGTFMSQGLRGTSRIQRTVPFGEQWFRP
jgi:hypothetical protein